MSSQNRQEGAEETSNWLRGRLAGSWNSFHVSQTLKTWPLHVGFQLSKLDVHISQTSLSLPPFLHCIGNGSWENWPSLRRESERPSACCFDIVTGVCEWEMARACTWQSQQSQRSEAQGESWLHLFGTLMSQHFRWNLGKREPVPTSTTQGRRLVARALALPCRMPSKSTEKRRQRWSGPTVNKCTTHLKAHRTVERNQTISLESVWWVLGASKCLTSAELGRHSFLHTASRRKWQAPQSGHQECSERFLFRPLGGELISRAGFQTTPANNQFQMTCIVVFLRQSLTTCIGSKVSRNKTARCFRLRER
jgi:hypothetical protein